MSDNLPVWKPIGNPDNLPVVPKLPPEFPERADGIVAICGECGRGIHRVEGYSCQNTRCPVQPRVTCSQHPGFYMGDC